MTKMLSSRFLAFIFDAFIVVLLFFLSKRVGVLDILSPLKFSKLQIYWGFSLSFYFAYSFICQSVFNRTLGKIVFGLAWEHPDQKQLFKRLIYKLFLLYSPFFLILMQRGFLLFVIPYYAFLFVSYYHLLLHKKPLLPDNWAKQKLISTKN